MKRFILYLVGAVALAFFVFYRLDVFSLSKIHGPLAIGRAEPPDREAWQNIQQPYFYLGKGRQSFVFLSQDGSHVIKFINYRRISFSPIYFSFPLPERWKIGLKKWQTRKQLRFHATLNSFHLGMTRLREYTLLEYVHCQSGEGLPKLTVFDNWGLERQIDLNDVGFIMQRTVTPMTDEFEHRWQSEGQKGLQDAIEQYFALIQRRCDLCIADDAGKNTGYADGKAVLMDVGRIFYDPSLQFQDRIDQEFKKGSKKLRKWLMSHHPESMGYYHETMKRFIGKSGVISQNFPKNNWATQDPFFSFEMAQ